MKAIAQNVLEQVVGKAGQMQYNSHVKNFEKFLSTLHPPVSMNVCDEDSPTLITMHMANECKVGVLKYDTADVIRSGLVYYYKHIQKVAKGEGY